MNCTCPKCGERYRNDGALIPDNSNSPAEDYILNDNASSLLSGRKTENR